MKNLFKTGVLFLASVIFLGSCKKDDNQPAKLTPEQIQKYADVSTKISTQMQASAMTYLSKAFEMGFTGDLPDIGSKKSGTQVGVNNYDWHGPDAQGWYYRSWEGLYKFTEKIRTRKDTVDHIYVTEYDGADGSYKYEIASQYVKYIKNKKELYKGYTKIEDHSSGYNNISRTSWKMTFDDYDPTTGAGTFDWYWGVSANSGGYTVPTHRYLHIEATPTTNNWLHVRVIIYDEKGTKVWDFEYDTPFEPVDLSE